jgi:alpha-tubulin suppressor-like RCC1 family protein
MVSGGKTQAICLLVLALTACGGGDTPPPSQPQPLTVTSTNPPNTAVGADLQKVIVRFTNSLNVQTVSVSSFILSGPSGPVSGSVSANGNTATFIPNQPLDFATDYTAIVTTAIRDQSNQQLVADYVWHFNTGKQIALSMDDGNHTCVRLTDGRVKCWGINVYGQLGQGDTLTRGDQANEMGANLPAINLGSGRIAVQIVTGRDHVCARLDNLTIKCWGKASVLGLGNSANNRGDAPNEMGDDLPVVDLGTNRIALELAAGGEHTCARLDNGQMKCWGNGIALGLGDPNNRGDTIGEMGDMLPALNLGSGRTAIAIYTGWRHTCVKLDTSEVKCWGYNASGQLGYGDLAIRGTTSQTVPANLPVLDIGSGRSIVSMSLAGQHSCALLDNGRVKCWGENNWGQLGQGDTTDRGGQAGEMGDALPYIELGTGRTVVKLGSGYDHNCAILDNSDLKCWGFQGATGQLGYGTQFGNGVGDAANEMGDNLPVVNLGTGVVALEVIGGSTHTCARLDNAEVKCWGVNSSGQLGLGDTVTRGDQISEMGDNLPAVDLGL